jgi:hypothetical protein
MQRTVLFVGTHRLGVDGVCVLTARLVRVWVFRFEAVEDNVLLRGNVMSCTRRI